MYKTIRFEIALCTNTKDKAQRKSEGRTEGEKVKTKLAFFFCFFLGAYLLRWVEGFEVLCLFALLPTYISAGYNHHDNNDEWEWRRAQSHTHMDSTYPRWHLQYVPHVTFTITSMMSKHRNNERDASIENLGHSDD